MVEVAHPTQQRVGYFFLLLASETEDNYFICFLEGMKRGICPIPFPVDVCEEESDDECALDTDCFGDMKCCSDSCQKLCVQPPQSKLATRINFIK